MEAKTEADLRAEAEARNTRLSDHADKIGQMLADLIETARELRAEVGHGSPGRHVHVVVTNLETAGLWLILANEELRGGQIADGVLLDGLRRI